MDTGVVQNIQFQAAHRLPSEAARKLPPGTGVSIYPDLPPEISDLRSKLLNERFALPKDERKKLKLIYTKEFPFVSLKKVNRG